MKKKRMLALLLTVAMAGTMLAGCGRSDGKEDEKGKNQAKSEGKVYYLNFKPEQADDWVKLAETYTDETGVQVDVQTAASGTYESQLKSEMAKEEAPTLFQVNGPVGLASWKDYCYDLSDSQIYKDISSDDYVLKEGDEVKGIAYVVETYGIIYNKAILNQYFELSDAAVKSVDEMNNFETLKKEGIDNIIKERFIPWLKTDEFRDRDGELIFKGLKLYSIVYCYAMIDARYSHSNQQEMAGQFDFFFESGNEYTSDMMESVAMQIYVLHGHIVKVDGYEV